MKQWYQCPSCRAPVGFGVRFCGNCGTQMNWPAQQQGRPYSQQRPSHYQQQRYDYNGQQKKKKRSTSWIIVLGSVFAFIVLISVIVGISVGKPSSLPNGMEIIPITVNAEQLCQAYDANQVAADAMYKNKILKVSGVVEDIGRDWLGYAEVELLGAEYSTRRYTVQCTFNAQNEYLVTQLSKGQSVIIQGTCDGREMFLYSISLKNCTIIETSSTVPIIPPKQLPNVIEVSAIQLCKDYEANEVAADDKYKNNILNVTGVVTNIGKTIDDDIAVHLDGGKFMWSVVCYFDKQNSTIIAQLSKGQPVILQGKCTGYLFISTVYLDDCTIVKQK